MKTAFLAIVCAVTLLCAGCDQIGQGSPDLRAQAARACTGSGFPARSTDAAPGVPCADLAGMVGEPPGPGVPPFIQ